MGELHLDIVVDRLRREYGVDAHVGRPQVVYRETLAKAAEAEARFEREIEDEKVFGQARVRVAPRPRGSGNQVSLAVTKVRVAVRCARIPDTPRAILDAALEGATEAMRSGPRGLSLRGHRRVCHRHRVPPRRSTPAGQRAAVGEALRLASREAGTRLLDPS